MRVPSWVFDPSWILRARGIEPDPWQQDFLLAIDSSIMLNCSRQVGKTTVVAALALHHALVCPGQPVVVVAPSLRQSLELYKQVLQCWEAIDQPVGIHSKGKGQFQLENGSRVLALPASESTIRGIGGVGLLIIDEASRVNDDLYRSVCPMIAASQGRMVVLSTPYGRRGWFYGEWIGPKAWRRFEVPWHHCPRIPADFIAKERLSLGDDWVRQEYECAFVSGSGLVYPDFAKTLETPSAPITGKPVGGIDFGWRNPFAAIWGHLTEDGTLWITGERVMAQTTLSEHARALPRRVFWWADPAGRTEIEELRAAGLQVRPGVNALDAGIAAVTARIRRGTFKVDPRSCPVLRREAELYRWPDEDSQKEATRINPIDADNHALAALRYLIMGIDRGQTAGERVRSSESRTAPAPQSNLWNTHLWHPGDS